MMSARSPQMLLLALVVSAAIWAAPAADQRSGAAPVRSSGVYQVNFNVQGNSAVADGAVIACRARITPNLPTLGHGSAPVVTVEGLTTAAGSSANCAVEIPFSWAGIGRSSGVLLSYEVVAMSGARAVVRKQPGFAVAYPAPGSTASLHFNLAF